MRAVVAVQSERECFIAKIVANSPSSNSSAARMAGDLFDAANAIVGLRTVVNDIASGKLGVRLVEQSKDDRASSRAYLSQESGKQEAVVPVCPKDNADYLVKMLKAVVVGSATYRHLAIS